MRARNIVGQHLLLCSRTGMYSPPNPSNRFSNPIHNTPFSNLAAKGFSFTAAAANNIIGFRNDAIHARSLRQQVDELDAMMVIFTYFPDLAKQVPTEYEIIRNYSVFLKEFKLNFNSPKYDSWVITPYTVSNYPELI
jgi:hypothetical protein